MSILPNRSYQKRYKREKKVRNLLLDKQRRKEEYQVQELILSHFKRGVL